MFDLKNTKRLKEKSIFYVPQPLKYYILRLLNEAGIPYESLTPWQIRKNCYGKRIPEGAPPTEEEEQAKFYYLERGYKAVDQIDGIVSDVPQKDLLKCADQFFDGTGSPIGTPMDEDWAAYLESHVESLKDAAIAELEAMKENRAASHPSVGCFLDDESGERIMDAAITIANNTNAWPLNEKHMVCSVFLPKEDYGYSGVSHIRDKKTKKITEYYTEEMCLVVEKEDSGYIPVLMFPFMDNPWITPTGSNTEKEIRETEEFKKASPLSRAHMLYFIDHDPEYPLCVLHDTDDPETDDITIAIKDEKTGCEHHIILMEQHQFLYTGWEGEIIPSRYTEIMEAPLKMSNIADFSSPEVQEAFYEDYPDVKPVIETLFRLIAIELLKDIRTRSDQDTDTEDTPPNENYMM